MGLRPKHDERGVVLARHGHDGEARQAEHPAVAGRLLEVRYEALVAEPEATLRRILDFIDEPWDAAVLSHHTKNRAHEPLEASTQQAIKPLTDRSIGRWKTEMTRLDKAAFKEKTGDVLKLLGYAADDAW